MSDKPKRIYTSPIPNPFVLNEISNNTKQMHRLK